MSTTDDRTDAHGPDHETGLATSQESVDERRRREELEAQLTDAQKQQVTEAVRRSDVSLAASLSRKYLSVGRQALSDSAPRRLDSHQRGELRDVLGVDPHDVRIHTGPAAESAADAFGARAFTMGTRDVYFGRSQYDPVSPEGKALLAHELTHVYEDSLPVAFSLHEDVTSKGPARDGEEHARTAEEAMYKEARRDKWLDDQEDQMAYGELSVGEKMILVDKIHKIMKTRQRGRSDRTGK